MSPRRRGLALVERRRTTYKGTRRDSSAGHLIQFEAHFTRSEKPKGTCGRCGRPTRRSHVTEILHEDCYICRRLVMIYGPSITVERVEY